MDGGPDHNFRALQCARDPTDLVLKADLVQLVGEVDPPRAEARDHELRVADRAPRSSSLSSSWRRPRSSPSAARPERTCLATTRRDCPNSTNAEKRRESRHPRARPRKRRCRRYGRCPPRRDPIAVVAPAPPSPKMAILAAASASLQVAAAVGHFVEIVELRQSAVPSTSSRSPSPSPSATRPCSPIIFSAASRSSALKISAVCTWISGCVCNPSRSGISASEIRGTGLALQLQRAPLRDDMQDFVALLVGRLIPDGVMARHAAVCGTGSWTSVDLRAWANARLRKTTRFRCFPPEVTIRRRDRRSARISMHHRPCRLRGFCGQRFRSGGDIAGKIDRGGKSGEFMPRPQSRPCGCLRYDRAPAKCASRRGRSPGMSRCFRHQVPTSRLQVLHRVRGRISGRSRSRSRR